MKITDIQIFLYSIPFKRPYRVRSQTVNHREGAIIKITNDYQICGYGEISPLPEINQESLNEAIKQFLVAKTNLIGFEIPDEVKKLNGELGNLFTQFHLPPSVLYGLEMTVLNLLANQHNIKVCELISEDQVEKIPICALLQDDSEDILRDIQKYCAQGHHAIKIKVGKLPLEEEIRRIQKIEQMIQGKALLRLDANQSWNINKAVTFANEVGLAAVEYIEEPIKDLAKSEEFFMKTTIPIAVDESLTQYDFNTLKSFQGVDVLIIKPLALGGVEKSWRLIQNAKGLALKTIISSSFETGLGISFLANLGACTRTPYPVGLDTLKWFEVDVLKKPLTAEQGMLTVPQPIRFDDELNFDILTLVE